MSVDKNKKALWIKAELHEVAKKLSDKYGIKLGHIAEMGIKLVNIEMGLKNKNDWT